MNIFKIFFLTLFFIKNSHAINQALIDKVVNEIRQESLLPTISEAGYPLPLAANWNSGELPSTFDPMYQLTLIEQGHHLLPWFHMDMPTQKNHTDVDKYYRDSILKTAKLNLPISFVSTQWERILSEDSKYFYLPKIVNPNVVTNSGLVEKKVSPMGSDFYWNLAGKEWTSTSIIKQLQSWYPNPPFILFISNNEHQKLGWDEANTDQRFVNTYGLNTSEDQKKQILSQHWQALYRQLISGMREGLQNPQWQKNSKFIGYNAFGPSSMGRWSGWTRYTLATNSTTFAGTIAFEGASPPFYTNDFDPSTDYNVIGPMIGSMNWIPMKSEALELNPNFWFEISLWDGSQPGLATDKRKYYQSQGQTYSPKRYGGMAKYAMWLLRPRIVREFRNTRELLYDTGSYFMEIVYAIDELYNNPNLEKFWRNGRLVANDKYTHPYSSNLFDKYKNQTRWFLLDTNYDPPKPWKMDTNIQVFSIALELGEKPNREWLVYSYSPLRDIKNVKVDIPSYKIVTVNSTVNGQYDFFSENASTNKYVNPNKIPINKKL